MTEGLYLVLAVGELWRAGGRGQRSGDRGQRSEGKGQRRGQQHVSGYKKPNNVTQSLSRTQVG